ncbi:hypothetical protein BDN67DRAFT_966847 [Paxillus ammoniavirescens]|nr:hypothetical protein BDN67DRAFT_966847 [Paxillus ammoniavirescens]
MIGRLSAKKSKPGRSSQNPTERMHSPSLDSNVAWELGNIIRKNCIESFTWPAVVYISHANLNQPLAQ